MHSEGGRVHELTQVAFYYDASLPHNAGFLNDQDSRECAQELARLSDAYLRASGVVFLVEGESVPDDCSRVSETFEQMKKVDCSAELFEGNTFPRHLQLGQGLKQEREQRP